MERKFDMNAALHGAKVKTRIGLNAKVISKTDNKLFVFVQSKLGANEDYYAKYNLDGSRWSPNSPSGEDLIMC